MRLFWNMDIFYGYKWCWCSEFIILVTCNKEKILSEKIFALHKTVFYKPKTLQVNSKTFWQIFLSKGLLPAILKSILPDPSYSNQKACFGYYEWNICKKVLKSCNKVLPIIVNNMNKLFNKITQRVVSQDFYLL